MIYKIHNFFNITKQRFIYTVAPVVASEVGSIQKVKNFCYEHPVLIACIVITCVGAVVGVAYNSNDAFAASVNKATSITIDVVKKIFTSPDYLEFKPFTKACESNGSVYDVARRLNNFEFAKYKNHFFDCILTSENTKDKQIVEFIFSEKPQLRNSIDFYNLDIQVFKDAYKTLITPVFKFNNPIEPVVHLMEIPVFIGLLVLSIVFLCCFILKFISRVGSQFLYLAVVPTVDSSGTDQVFEQIRNFTSDHPWWSTAIFLGGAALIGYIVYKVTNSGGDPDDTDSPPPGSISPEQVAPDLALPNLEAEKQKQETPSNVITFTYEDIDRHRRTLTSRPLRPDELTDSSLIDRTYASSIFDSPTMDVTFTPYDLDGIDFDSSDYFNDSLHDTMLRNVYSDSPYEHDELYNSSYFPFSIDTLLDLPDIQYLQLFYVLYTMYNSLYYELIKLKIINKLNNVILNK